MASDSFHCGVSCEMGVYPALAGVAWGRMWHDPEAMIEAYRRGRPLAEEILGPDVSMPNPCWAPVSYGHLNTLGAKLVFPDDGEVAVKPLFGSLEEGIRGLDKDPDFTTQGYFPLYMKLWETLKRAFPDRQIPFTGFKAEGPITSGWLLRGHDFYADIIEQPDAAREYLHRVTRSVIAYQRLMKRVNGEPEVSPKGMGIVDDGSSMIGPNRWPELVVPYLEQYYSALTTGSRYCHIENLTAEHLRHLNQLRIVSYDPSVSGKLTPAIIRKHYHGRFGWVFHSFMYPDFSEEGIEQWVVGAAADGAASVSSYVSPMMIRSRETLEKVQAFIRAGKKVKRLIEDGCARDALRNMYRA